MSGKLDSSLNTPDEYYLRHYLITRFNVKQKNWNKDKNNSLLTVNEDWLKERFILFETYCLPSVQSQTCKNFKWLIYFDIDTPQHYKDKIECHRKLFPNLSPKFISGMEYLIESIKKDIIDSLDNKINDINNVVITSRLDNDDCLHEDFIKIIQKLIKSQSIMKGVIDIPNGFCLQVKPKPVLSRTIQFSNAFITYVEPCNSNAALLTVMSKPHPQWAYSVKTYFIEKKRLWMQIIHQKNVVNEVQGIIMNQKKLIINFNVKEDIEFERRKLSQRLFNSLINQPYYLLKKKVKKMWIKRRILITTLKKRDQYLK